MCGICGFTGYFENKEKILAEMMAELEHRGPDDNGSYVDDDIALGHLRLSIIDLKTGHQPIFNEDGSKCLIFNGEIYNFRQLRDALTRAGHKFKTQSDTEVIIHGFEEYGQKIVEHLRGMFAFAVWDKTGQSLFLARDRLGIKPLYWTVHNKSFVFASEIKSLLTIKGISKEIDFSALNKYLTFRYTPGNETAFKGIFKLQPGHKILIKNNQKPLISRYWDLSFTEERASNLKETIHIFRKKLEESVGLRLIADVPVGAYLSGGLDSSYLVAIMSKLSNSAISTFSVGFENENLDELEHAKKVAGYFHCKHQILFGKLEPIEILSKIIWHLDEPLADAATIPTYKMAQLTKKHVTVVLSGEGADECLAGYPKYKILTIGNRLNFFIPKTLFKATQPLFKNFVTLKRLNSYLASSSDKINAYINLNAVFSDQEKLELLSADALAQMNKTQRITDFIAPYFNNKRDFLSQLLHLDLKTWLPDDLLLKNDKMTMAHSVEARVPYLDHELVDLCTSLPSKYKLKGLTEKYILRQSMQGLVPASIIKRRKQGFTVPLSSWYNNGLEELANDILSPANIKKRGLFKPKTVAKILNSDISKTYNRRQFWTLLTFELWAQTFIDGKYNH